MACRETRSEVRAEDMRDPVTKQLEMAFIRYNPQVTTMEVRPQPDWRLKQSEEATDEEKQVGNEQRERLMACRRKGVRQVREHGRNRATTGWAPETGRPKQLEAGGGSKRGGRRAHAITGTGAGQAADWIIWGGPRWGLDREERHTRGQYGSAAWDNIQEADTSRGWGQRQQQRQYVNSLRMPGSG